MKILFFGAAMMLMSAGTALADPAGDATANMAEKPAVPSGAPRGAMDVSRMTVDPAIFDPTHVTRTHGTTIDASKAPALSSSPALRQAATQMGTKN